MTATGVVAVGVADVRRDPDSDSELVTQALLNVPVTYGEIRGEWVYVTLSDYEGWMRLADLGEPALKGFCKVGEQCGTPLDLAAVICITHTPLYEQPGHEHILETAYLSTVLPLLDITHPQYVQVALPGDGQAWIERAAVSIQRISEPYPRQPVPVVTDHARAFLDVPYLWGGTSYRGIDCSGFVQVCYRMAGVTLPRDADQQHDALVPSVERTEMREGDLIFFGRESITHVALALNEREYIHAEGQNYNRVVINSFGVVDKHYNERLDSLVRAIKRVVS